MKRAEVMSLREQAAWFFGFAEREPEVFPKGELGLLWYHAEELAEDPATFARYLRAGLLKRLWKAVGNCTACPLAGHRLKGRPVLDDGDWGNDPFSQVPGEKPAPVGALGAEIMLVGEGPGEYEQRTGQPFIGYYTLVGSSCARFCKEYEACFAPPEDEKGARVRWNGLPRQDCKPVPLKGDALPVLQERAAAKPWVPYTAGVVLDQALSAAGFFRESWNGGRRALGKDPLPATVYCCNVVKCRACDVDAKGDPQNREPHVEEIRECSRWLMLQILIVQPKVIVPLGNPAMRTLTGNPELKILSARAELYPGPGGIPLLPDVHPSYILRARDREHEIAKAAFEGLVETLKRAKELARGKEEVPWSTAPPEEEGLEAGSLESQWPGEDGRYGLTEREMDPELMETIPTFPPGMQPIRLPEVGAEAEDGERQAA